MNVDPNRLRNYPENTDVVVEYIFENEQHEIVIKAELPGVKKEDIDLQLENNMLTIRGERKRVQEAKEELKDIK